MSKKSEALAVAERIARSLGATTSQIESVKRELATVWGGSDASPVAPAAPRTQTFNVQVGVEVLASAHASQRDIEEGVRQALTAAASRRDEVVSFSVAGA